MPACSTSRPSTARVTRSAPRGTSRSSRSMRPTPSKTTPMAPSIGCRYSDQETDMAEGMIGGVKISDLPPSSFAYCEPGDGAVSDRCHFPIRDKNGKPDESHVRNALAQIPKSPFGPKARAKVEAAAKELGIGQKGSMAAMHSAAGADVLSDL